MTAATAVADEVLAVGLLDQPQEQRDKPGPAGATEEKSHRQEGERAPRPAGRRLRDVTAFSLIVVVQLCWLAGLGYGVFFLVS